MVKKLHVSGDALRVAARPQSFKRRLMAATSAGIMTLVAPVGGLYGMRASAQVNLLPAGCSDRTNLDPANNNNDGYVDDGETIACDGFDIDPIETDMDDVAIRVALTGGLPVGRIEAEASDTSPAISMDGDGTQSLTIGAYGYVENNGSADETVFIRSGDGDVTISHSGHILGDEVAVQALVGVNDFGAFQYGADRSTGYDSTGSGGDLALSVYGLGTIRSTIQAQSTGNGNIDIDVSSLETNSLSAGTAALEVHAGYQVDDVMIQVGDITGQSDQYGIYARHYGLGDSTITTTGDIDTGTYGILLDHYADGHATINIGGDITNTDGYTGVFVRQYGGTGLDIELDGAIDAGYRGIDATNTSGDVSIITTVNGDIYARDPAGTPASTAYDGIRVFNSGGETYIKADGTITTKYGFGIRLNHSGDGAAKLYANGDIDTTATVPVGGTNDPDAIQISKFGGYELNADGSRTGLIIEVDANIVTEGNAIQASNRTGDVMIETSAASFLDSDETAIYLTNSGDNTFITSSGDIYSDDGSGIDVRHSGSGETQIYADGNMDIDQTGIFVQSQVNTGDVTIKSYGSISPGAYGNGIDVRNYGVGSTDITLGTNSETFGSNGVRVQNSATTEDLTITAAGEIGASYEGIYAQNRTGNTTITTLASTEIRAGIHGIFAQQFETGEDLTITASGDIDAAQIGIYATNYGTGNTVITTQADSDIVGQESGIRAIQEDYGEDLTLNVYGTVRQTRGVPAGGDSAIRMSSTGTGNAYINVYGAVEAEVYGIIALPKGDGLTQINIAGRVNANTGTAIESSHEGTGTHSLITQAGSKIYARDKSAIFIETYDLAEAVTIELSGDVFGGLNALSVRTSENVDTSVSVQGRAISNAGYAAINTSPSNYGVDVTVGDGGFVAGEVSPEELVNAAISLGITSIDVEDATAPSGITTIALQTNTVSGFNANDLIDSVLADGISLSDLFDAAESSDLLLSITMGDEADALTLEAGGEIRGRALLSGGDDTFNYVGGTFGRILGGDGTDTVNVSGDARTFTNSGGSDDSVQEFEIFNFDNTSATTVGITLAGTHTGWEQANFNSGITVLDGNLTATTATIAADATLNARDGALFTGALINNGTLDIGSSPGLFQIVGGFTQTSTGVLPIEVEGILFDQLYVDGTATLGGTLNVIASSLPTTPTDYLIIDTTGGISGAFDTITDNLPDLDIALTQADGQIEIGFVAISTDDPDPDPDAGDAGDGDVDAGDNSGTVDGVVVITSASNGTPLLTAKEIAPSGLTASLHANDLFAANLIDRRSAHATSDAWQAWGNGFGGQRSVGQYEENAGWKGDTGGFAIGAERLIDTGGTPVLFGVAGGFTRTSLISEDSYAEIESIHFGSFASAEFDRLALAGALSYAWQEFDFERAVNLSTGPVVAYGDTDGSGWALKAEAFYDLASGAGSDLTGSGFQFGPLLTLDSTLGKYEGFEETNAGILNLEYVDEHAYQTVTGLGAAGDFQSELSGMVLRSRLNIVWEHLTGNRHVTTLATLDVDGAQFNPSSARMDANRVALGADALLELNDHLQAHIRYDTRHGDNLIEHAGWAGITLKF